MNNAFFLFFLILFLTGCSGKYDINKVSILNDPEYPIWLVSDSLRTNQTSGISYLYTDKKGIQCFLLADDVGVLHLLTIMNDTTISLKHIRLNEEFKLYLKSFPKADFEAVEFDRYRQSILLSIEGNDPDPVKSTAILELKFNNPLRPDSLISFRVLDIQPEDKIKKHISGNTCFEGIAVDSKYIYIALEGFVSEKMFADSTILYIVDKNSLQIIKEIDTKSLEIGTITGLVSDMDLSLWGIDRNSKNIFYIRFDDELNITAKRLFKVDTRIPNYDSFDYVASLEGISIDEEKNIYLVDDPWWRFFTPDEEILKNLDSITVSRFRELTPVLYRLHTVNQ